MVTVTFQEAFKAYQNFRTFRKMPSNRNSGIMFRNFLGIPENSTFDHLNDTGLPDDAARKIKWLSGPNAEIMYKIWKLQNDGTEVNSGLTQQTETGTE